MTISLTRAIRVAGVELAAGTTQTFSNDLESQLVANGSATWIRNPNRGGLVPVIGSVDEVTGGSIFSSGDRLTQIKERATGFGFSAKPIGFNAFDAAYAQLLNVANAATHRQTLFAYIRDCGANVVRIMLPIFSGGEYLSRVHSTATMPSTMTDENLRSSYVAALDATMNDAAEYGLKVHVCDFWNMDTLPAALGETSLVAYASTTSATAVYAKSAVKWFFSRYKTHPAFGVYSIGNEYKMDATGVLYPTPAQWGDYFSALANTARSIDLTHIITTSIQSPVVDAAPTRESLDAFATRMRIVYAGLDAYCWHIYLNGFSYVGRNALGDSGSFQNASFTQLGGEGLDSLLSSLRAIADADGKPMIIGEFSVTTDEESDTKWAKKSQFLNVVARYSDYGLLWNAQMTATVGAGQETTFIDPTTARGALFKAIVSRLNKVRSRALPVGGGVDGLLELIKPTWALRTIRVAAANARFTSIAAHATPTLAVAFWLNMETVANPYEHLFDLRSANTFGGVIALATASNPSYSFYLDFRSGSGSAGNAGVLPDIEVGTWNHFVFAWDKAGGVDSITTWVNGKYWRTQTAGVYAPISVGSSLNIGGANGGNRYFQDFTMIDTISPPDVFAHMRGEVLPRSTFHMRALPNGTLLDLSKNGVAITMDANTSIKRT